MLVLAILTVASVQNPFVPFYDRLREYKDGDVWEYVTEYKGGIRFKEKVELHLQLDDGKNRRFKATCWMDWPSKQGVLPLEPWSEAEFVQNLSSREVLAVGSRARERTSEGKLGDWTPWSDTRGKVLFPGTWNRDTRFIGSYNFGIELREGAFSFLANATAESLATADFEVKVFRYQNTQIRIEQWWNTQLGAPLLGECWESGVRNWKTTLKRTNVIVNTKKDGLADPSPVDPLNITVLNLCNVKCTGEL